MDERSEIAACFFGIPQNDLGGRTDVLDACPKIEGMRLMLRSMSPQVLAVDELGSREDCLAVEEALHCGCRILGTMHAKTIEDLQDKVYLSKWLDRGFFGRFVFLAATPLIALFLYYGKDKDLHRQVDERNEQMRMDYPEIVSALALLLGAGMTVPNAWNKIAKDYRKRREESGGNSHGKRYAYEEMLMTVYEMESGVMQTTAYERFGRRCRLPSYNKLAAMLSQNIRKGAANLPLLLKEEAADAFEDRKHSARKQGEKAGTKLLVPMMMLLGMTMVIIMVPAFQTYF